MAFITPRGLRGSCGSNTGMDWAEFPYYQAPVVAVRTG